LADLSQSTDPNLIAGMAGAEDAGVYKLTDDVAVIQTLDFFTPIVDDPYTFGQVAAANSLSDVYAMGGKPITAMNIVCFPVKKMDMAILKDILKGSLDKLNEAKVALVGGHSVEDDELKYGLSVTGTIHPDKVLRNTSAAAGDKLILTKALGTGIINTALKGDMASDEAVAKSIKCMTALNKAASEAMLEFNVSACTDVTGFGLLGHACEMIEGTNVGLKIHAEAVPCIAEAAEYASMGLLPGGLHRNRDFREHMVQMDKSVPGYLADIMYDPQTSGGLLIAVSEADSTGLLAKLHKAGITDAKIIGDFVAEPKGKIIVVQA
jgi:selenide,water dikinase